MGMIVCPWILSALPQSIVTHWPQGAWSMQQPAEERGREGPRGQEEMGGGGEGKARDANTRPECYSVWCSG